MKISADGNETTVIEFSKEELEGCRLTYENISRNVIKSRTAIHTIVTEAAKLSGNERLIDENTRIDILPDGEGGCIIILKTVLRTETESRRTMLFSEDADCFFDLARAVPDIPFSSLYKTEEGYFLYLEGEGSLLRRCPEFASRIFCDEVSLARLEEYGTPLIKGKALEVLGGRGSEK